MCQQKTMRLVHMQRRRDRVWTCPPGSFPCPRCTCGAPGTRNSPSAQTARLRTPRNGYYQQLRRGRRRKLGTSPHQRLRSTPPGIVSTLGCLWERIDHRCTAHTAMRLQRRSGRLRRAHMLRYPRPTNGLQGTESTHHYRRWRTDPQRTAHTRSCQQWRNDPPDMTDTRPHLLTRIYPLRRASPRRCHRTSDRRCTKCSDGQPLQLVQHSQLP